MLCDFVNILYQLGPARILDCLCQLGPACVLRPARILGGLCRLGPTFVCTWVSDQSYANSGIAPFDRPRSLWVWVA